MTKYGKAKARSSKRGQSSKLPVASADQIKKTLNKKTKQKSKCKTEAVPKPSKEVKQWVSTPKLSELPSQKQIRAEAKKAEGAARVAAIKTMFSDFKAAPPVWVLYENGTVFLGKETREQLIARANQELESNPVQPGTGYGDFSVADQDPELRPGCDGVTVTTYSDDKVMSIAVSTPFKKDEKSADRDERHQIIGMTARAARMLDSIDFEVVHTSLD
jgi:hypothetical protein